MFNFGMLVQLKYNKIETFLAEVNSVRWIYPIRRV